MPIIPARCKLIFGLYQAPPLHVGDRADCLMRDTLVVTSWTGARISWPRCKPLEGRSHPALPLDDELARAVRTEAAAAVCIWWGVSDTVVCRWRKFFDVARVNNPGMRRLIQASAEAGAQTQRDQEWTEAEL